jgi:signal transduction histidine kinase
MKPSLLILLSLLSVFTVPAQTAYSIDTTNISKDTNGVKKLVRAARLTSFTNPEEGRRIVEKAIHLANEIGSKKAKADALHWYSYTFTFSGDYPTALKILFEVLQIDRELKDSFQIAEIMGEIGVNYNQLQQYRLALEYLEPASRFFQRLTGMYRGSFELATMANVYLGLKLVDSALYCGHKAFELYRNDPAAFHLRQYLLRSIGNIYAQKGKTDSALSFYRWSIFTSDSMNDKLNTLETQVQIADLYTHTHVFDSAFWYAKIAFDHAQSFSVRNDKLKAAVLLVNLYQQKQKKDSALFYLQIASAIKDTLYGPEKVRQLQLLALDEQQKQQDLLHQHEQYKNNIKYITLLSVLVVFLLLSFILYRSNKHKQQANSLLQKQKEKIESTLVKLRAVQAQLIQSEKMASLGELTAGIAHEIQNPLNFVNNFSEANKELIEELQAEAQNGHVQEVMLLAADIKANEEKITQHGRRADSIVKSMMEHSRNAEGQKQATDLNVLVDEYLKLAYHGFRTKDGSFTAIPETHFDHHLGKIDVHPQEIGRVLLNLFNNAFYAVQQKKKQLGGAYEPLVQVSTANNKGLLEIAVKDNGIGIPEKIREKIFQPFFTTKPPGEGTGLGLSLSYDIVKAQGGEIAVESKEGEGSEFVVKLPFSESTAGEVSEA